MTYTLNKALLVSMAAVTLLLTSVVAYAHTGHTNEGAVLSCETKKRSQSCQYTGGHNDLYIGFCRYRYMTGDDLICVRTEPIRKADPDREEPESTHQHTDTKQ